MSTSSPTSTSVADPPPTVAWSEQMSLPAPTGMAMASSSASAAASGAIPRMAAVRE
jgi:hypothetical protein